MLKNIIVLHESVLAFCRDIPSNGKKFPDGKGKKSRIPGILNKSQGSTKTPGIKIPKLRKIPIPGDKNPESPKKPESLGIAQNPEVKKSRS